VALENSKVSYDPLYFGLIIDAGSSGTRVRIFRWTLRSKVDLTEVAPVDEDESLFEVKPGLDSYADDPRAALPPLSKMLKAAQGYVPKAVWDESQLFLKATGGMRLLERSKADRLMKTVREFLSDAENCPFKFVSAEIISGEQEAVFSYITTNYNLGTLSTPSKTAGALEMGGASMQVVFRPATAIQDNEFQFYMAGERQSVYAKSYLRFGVDDAMKRMLAVLARQSLVPLGLVKDEVESPCHNPGFNDTLPIASGGSRRFVGTGNSSACAEVLRKVMGLDIECLMPPCAIFGSYMSPVQGDTLPAYQGW
jgi:Golgi nucleoside diphosphatase